MDFRPLARSSPPPPLQLNLTGADSHVISIAVDAEAGVVAVATQNSGVIFFDLALQVINKYPPPHSSPVSAPPSATPPLRP
jgi:hypothetical protein